jgi:hypothetical protein
MAWRSLEPSFEAALAAPQDEVEGGSAGVSVRSGERLGQRDVSRAVRRFPIAAKRSSTSAAA